MNINIIVWFFILIGFLKKFKMNWFIDNFNKENEDIINNIKTLKNEIKLKNIKDIISKNQNLINNSNKKLKIEIDNISTKVKIIDNFDKNKEKLNLELEIKNNRNSGKNLKKEYELLKNDNFQMNKLLEEKEKLIEDFKFNENNQEYLKSNSTENLRNELIKNYDINKKKIMNNIENKNLNLKNLNSQINDNDLEINKLRNKNINLTMELLDYENIINLINKLLHIIKIIEAYDLEIKICTEINGYKEKDKENKFDKNNEYEEFLFGNDAFNKESIDIKYYCNLKSIYEIDNLQIILNNRNINVDELNKEKNKLTKNREEIKEDMEKLLLDKFKDKFKKLELETILEKTTEKIENINSEILSSENKIKNLINIYKELKFRKFREDFDLNNLKEDLENINHNKNFEIKLSIKQFLKSEILKIMMNISKFEKNIEDLDNNYYSNVELYLKNNIEYEKQINIINEEIIEIYKKLYEINKENYLTINKSQKSINIIENLKIESYVLNNIKKSFEKKIKHKKLFFNFIIIFTSSIIFTITILFFISKKFNFNN